jgi:hypothetical protein
VTVCGGRKQGGMAAPRASAGACRGQASHAQRISDRQRGQAYAWKAATLQELAWPRPSVACEGQTGLHSGAHVSATTRPQEPCVACDTFDSSARCCASPPLRQWDPMVVEVSLPPPQRQPPSLQASVSGDMCTPILESVRFSDGCTNAAATTPTLSLDAAPLTLLCRSQPTPATHAASPCRTEQPAGQGLNVVPVAPSTSVALIGLADHRGTPPAVAVGANQAIPSFVTVARGSFSGSLQAGVLPTSPKSFCAAMSRPLLASVLAGPPPWRWAKSSYAASALLRHSARLAKKAGRW